MSALVVPSIFRAIDRMSGPLGAMTRRMQAFARDTISAGERMEKRLGKISKATENISKQTGIAGAAILAPLGLAAKSAIDFEDKMADVAKTTGLSGPALDKFGKSLLAMSTKTRTSIDDLLKIGEIGGQLGVATPELLAFTDAANKFGVALGGDYSGGIEEAVASVGKLQLLFKETRNLPIADVITKAGSAINSLGAAGNGTAHNINDFMLRIGALPDAIKPSITNSAALGTFFEEAGIDSQLASGGLSNFLLVAGKNMAGFAKQMHLGDKAAAALLKNDPTEFAKKFAMSLNGMSPTVLAKKLDDLKIGSQETIKVLGAMGAGTKRLTDLQAMANSSFAEGTSLLSEYNVKNSTTASKLAIAKNNFQRLAIVIGEKLLPVVSRLVEKVMPYVERLVDWIGRNKELATTIIQVTAAVGGALMAISAVNGVISILAKATWLWTAAEWALNTALFACPLVWIILLVVGLIAAIVAVVKHTRGWGEQWDEITKWMTACMVLFKSAVVLACLGLKEAFMTMVDAIVEGWYWAMNKIGVKSDEEYKAEMDRIQRQKDARMKAIRETTQAMEQAAAQVAKGPAWKLTWDSSGDDPQPGDVTAPGGGSTSGAFNPKAAMAQLQMQYAGAVDVNINDNTGTATVGRTTGNIKPKLTSTVGQR